MGPRQATTDRPQSNGLLFTKSFNNFRIASALMTMSLIFCSKLDGAAVVEGGIVVTGGAIVVGGIVGAIVVGGIVGAIVVGGIVGAIVVGGIVGAIVVGGGFVGPPPPPVFNSTLSIAMSPAQLLPLSPTNFRVADLPA